MSKWLFLGGAIVSEVSGSLSLKGALDHTWLYAVVVVGFCTAFICLSFSMRHGMPLGVAYGIWGATGVAATACLSAVFFGERLTPLMLSGIGLIIIGVLAIELGSHGAHRTEQDAA